MQTTVFPDSDDHVRVCNCFGETRRRLFDGGIGGDGLDVATGAREHLEQFRTCVERLHKQYALAGFHRRRECHA